MNLLAKLKDLRRVLAEQKGVPAYVIFSNATLVDMCIKHPTTLDELLEVSGIGQVKLEQYGEIFLQALSNYYSNTQTK